MMNPWLEIALVAYLIGAAIEGVSTASQLFHSMPELTENSQKQSTDPSSSPSFSWRVVSAILSVSVCGACFWPCRLVHRSLK
jgi:hypothetical protein